MQVFTPIRTLFAHYSHTIRIHHSRAIREPFATIRAVSRMPASAARTHGPARHSNEATAAEDDDDDEWDAPGERASAKLSVP